MLVLDNKPRASASDRIEYISQVRDITFPLSWYLLNSVNHFWFAWRFRATLRMFRDLHMPLDRDNRVLDIGCGTGMLARQIENDSEWTVDGTDLNLEALKQHY